MTTLITNIKRLVGVRKTNSPHSYRGLRGKELAELPAIEDAYLIIEDGVIAAYGAMQDLKSDGSRDRDSKSEINAVGQLIVPCWCDSHTHLVFASSREEEFVDKIKGMSYAEIAAKGGGIFDS